MSHLIKIYAVCKIQLFLSLVLKALRMALLSRETHRKSLKRFSLKNGRKLRRVPIHMKHSCKALDTYTTELNDLRITV